MDHNLALVPLVEVDGVLQGVVSRANFDGGATIVSAASVGLLFVFGFAPLSGIFDLLFSLYFKLSSRPFVVVEFDSRNDPVHVFESWIMSEWVLLPPDSGESRLLRSLFPLLLQLFLGLKSW